MNIETIAALAEKNIERAPVNLRDFARTQLSHFSQHGFKEIIQDSYKFTNLDSFFSCLEDGVSSAEVPQEEITPNSIIFKDGILKTPEILPDGVHLRPFNFQSDEVKDLFVERTPLSSLHHAFLGEGIVIEITKGNEVSAPLKIVHLLTSSKISSPTVLIIAHPGSRITIQENIKSVGAVSSALIGETYLKIHPTASVEYISLDEGNSIGINHTSMVADVDKDGDFRSFFLSLAGKMNRKNLTLNLNAPGANGENYALFLTNGKEHSDFHTEMNHRSPDTTSNQIAKGILDENSKGIFTGRIHIFPKAQRVSSGQLNKNLLLSNKAQVHSQPQLEIFADDVKCSHGSTTGQLSSDEVFYFQARGIPEERAKALIALGFGLEIVQKIKNSEAQKDILSIVRKRLADKFSIGGNL
jgi:Fe-S cluster assembly protein SufD